MNPEGKRENSSENAAPVAPPALSQPRIFSPRALLDGAALLCATTAAYVPALKGGLLWDDPAHVTKAELRSWNGLWRIWFDLGATQQYYPVLHTAFWLEHRLWGDAVVGYHLLNIFLHTGSAWLFVILLRRLWGSGGPVGQAVGLAPGQRPGLQINRTKKAEESFDAAFLAGSLFALHPVCVESVAWISEQKNTLSTVFYLLAALTYLHFRENAASRMGASGRAAPAAVSGPRPATSGLYWLAMVFFILALGSKSVTATLPAALLVIFWWRNGRLSLKRDVLPLLPWFAVALSAGLFTAWVERRIIGATGETFDLSFVQRCWLAGRVTWFYLAKLVWPSNLIFFYPHWEVKAWPAWAGLYPLAVAALMAGLWLFRRRSRGPLAGLMFYVGSLFPALGFFNVYPFVYSYVADHFQYLATFGVVALAAAGWAWWDSWSVEARRQIAGPQPSGFSKLRGFASAAGGPRIVAAAAICGLGILTWRQCLPYRDLPTLYRATLERNPDSWMAHNNFGFSLVEAGRFPEAIMQFQEALRLKPDYAQAHYNLANELAKIPGRGADAIAHYEAALRFQPANAEAHYNLAIELAKFPGRENDAIAHYEEALRLKPDFSDADYNLANQLARIPDRAADAIAHYEAALRLKPDYAAAHDNLASVLAKIPGRRNEAIAHFKEALRLKPDNAAAHNNLANLLATIPDRRDEAVAEYKEALRLKPDSFGFEYNFAGLLVQMRRFDEAIAHLEKALKLNPASREARVALEKLRAWRNRRFWP